MNIEHGIPLPDSASPLDKKDRGSKWPFKTMAVGDSFFVPKPEHQTLRSLQQQVNTASWKYRRAAPETRFATRQYNNPLERGVRCWRTW